MNDPESRDMRRQVYNNLCRAEAFVREGEWVAADDCFAKAVADDVSPASRIAFASSLAERERFYDALCQMTAALDLASADGDREALGVIYHNLAAIYRELGDAELAKRFQQRAILQMDDCGPDDLLGLANDAWLANRRTLAEGMAASAADLGEFPGQPNEAEATAGLLTALTRGEERMGIRRLLRVYRQHKSKAAYRLMGIDLLNLSILFGEIGRHQGEITLVEQAIRCFDRAAAPVSSARAQQILATLLRARSLRDFDPTRN